MTTKHLEIEHKYDVAQDLPWVDLSTVDGVAAVEPAQVVALTATYYDTPALRLARAGITLRRRAGGSDAGWTMKLPVASDREEHGEPLGEDGEPVPAALLDLVRAWARDHEAVSYTHLRAHETDSYLVCR